MKFKSTSITCIFLLTVITSIAQKKEVAVSKASSKNVMEILKITMESDSSTKSVLVSNVMEEKSGDMSPVIGAANWMERDKKFQCNSLIEFDFDLLPVEILNNPLLILQADLILYPVNAVFADNDNQKKSVLYIRKVLTKWDDSTTKWKNQPNTNFENQTVVTIEVESKSMPVTIDVTNMVIHSIMNEKNNGFLIAYDENLDTTFSSGQLFASPKNANPDIRPQLIIYLEYQKDKDYTKKATPIKPANNSLNEIYWKRNTNYGDLNNPNSNFIYNMNLRPGSPLLPRNSTSN